MTHASAMSVYKGYLLKNGGLITSSVVMFFLLAFPFFFVNAASSWNPTLLVNTEAFQVIDDANDTADIELRFGESLNAKIFYDRANARFNFTKSIYVQGSVILTGSLVMTSITQSGGVAYSSGTQVVFTPKGQSGQLLVSQATAAPQWKTPIGGMVWFIDGLQSVANTQGAQVTMPFAMTLSGVSLNVKGAPTGAALIIDIRKNGTSVFSTKPQVNAAATTGGSNAIFSTTDVPINSLMTLDVTQVGSTYAGSGLTVIVKGTRKY